MLITLEGGDGSGKRTQAELLKAELEKKGYETLSLSYPDYSSLYGQLIYDHVLNCFRPISVDEQFLMYLVDQVKDKKLVLRSFDEGKIVITDRYFLSTIAYQTAGGFDYETAKQMEILMGLPKPSIVFYFDVPVKVAIALKYKQNGKLDGFEKQIAYQEGVKAVFERLMTDKSLPLNWVRIDCIKGMEGSPEDIMRSKGNIHEEVMLHVNKLLNANAKTLRRADAEVEFHPRKVAICEVPEGLTSKTPLRSTL